MRSSVAGRTGIEGLRLGQSISIRTRWYGMLMMRTLSVKTSLESIRLTTDRRIDFVVL